MQANIDSGMYYYGLVQERRENPQDDMISRLIAAEIPGEDGRLRKLDDIEITGFATLLGGAGAETVTKLVGSAMVVFARNPEQWQKLLDDRSKIPAAVEELLRYDGPVQYNVRYSVKDVAGAQRHHPGQQAGVPDGGRGQPRPAGLHRRARRSTSTATAPRRRTSASATASTAASVPRWPAWRASIALEHLLDFMPRYEVDFDGLQRVHMQNVAGYSPRPGEGAAVSDLEEWTGDRA